MVCFYKKVMMFIRSIVAIYAKKIINKEDFGKDFLNKPQL